MSGQTTGRQVLTSAEGMGSRVQVGVFMPVSVLWSSAGEIRENWENDLVIRGALAGGGLGGWSWKCSFGCGWSRLFPGRTELHLSAVMEWEGLFEELVYCGEESCGVTGAGVNESRVVGGACGVERNFVLLYVVFV